MNAMSDFDAMTLKEIDAMRFGNISPDDQRALRIHEINGGKVQFIRSKKSDWKSKHPSKPFHPQGIYRIAGGSDQ